MDELFISNGFIKEKQIITHMSFPFAKRDEYNKAFENHSENEKLLYKIEMDNGIVWVKHIEVGNTIYVKP